MGERSGPAERSGSSPALPERVGRYEVLLPIASGGMATVYLARSRGVGGFERDVALKLTHAHLRESEEFALDLIEEAKLAVRIRHPNVVPVIDVGDDPFGLYLVMEYVEGDTLGGLIRRARQGGTTVPLPISVRILVDALAGLHAAHELRDEAGQPANIVHRDFSPQNILVGVDGMSRLADFGIAKAATRLGQTRSGLVKGKIAYMAPEQARARTLDRRCDVWAGGVIAWELLAGRRLYSSDDVATLLEIVTTPPPRLREIRPELPAAVDEAVARALTIDLGARSPTAAAFAKELLAVVRSWVGVAEQSEVGDYVASVAGPKLAERRTRAAEIVELRARMGSIVGRASESSIGTPSSETSRAREVLMGATGPPVTSADPAATARQASPSSARSLADARTARAEPGATGTDTVSVSTFRGARGAFGLAAAVGPKRLVLAALIGASLTTGGLVAVLSSGGPEPASPATAPPTPDQPPELASPANASAESPPPAAPTSTAPRATRLAVSANAPIATLRIDTRTVPVSKPGKTVTVDLPEGDRPAESTVEATSVDGRKASATIGPTLTSLQLTFPPMAPGSKKPGVRLAAPPQSWK